MQNGTLAPLADYANGIEAGLVVVVFGHALLTETFIGVLVLFALSQAVLPHLHAAEGGD